MTDGPTRIGNGHRLRAGGSISQRGSVNWATVTGWFECPRVGEPVLVSVAHLLTVRRAWLEAVVPWTPDGRTLSLEAEGVVLGRRGDETPVLRVLASGRFDRSAAVSTVDAMIATSLGSPPAGLEPIAVASPIVGRSICGHDGRDRGRIVGTSLPPGPLGAAHDFWVAPGPSRSEDGFGDSGAPLFDAQTGALVGMHVGQARKLAWGGTDHPVLNRAHDIGEIMAVFGLGVALGEPEHRWRGARRTR